MEAILITRMWRAIFSSLLLFLSLEKVYLEKCHHVPNAEARYLADRTIRWIKLCINTSSIEKINKAEIHTI